jgi:hypothetical protein
MEKYSIFPSTHGNVLGRGSRKRLKLMIRSDLSDPLKSPTDRNLSLLIWASAFHHPVFQSDSKTERKVKLLLTLLIG